MILGIRYDQLLHEHTDRTGLVFRHTGPLHLVPRTLGEYTFMCPLSECASAVKTSLLQYLPPLFVQCDLCLYRRKILAGQITEIALIAADAERRHGEPCLKRRHAERLVVGARRHMRAHNGHRIAVGIAGLNLRPAERIRVVGRPDLWKIG